MDLDYVWKLRLKIWKTNVKVQKIDGSILEIFGIIITNLQVEDKVGRSRFSQKKFLIANIKFEVILEMLFLKISNMNISFSKETLYENFIPLTRFYLLPSKSNWLI